MTEHAEQVNDYLIRNLGLTPFECDGLLGVIKKQKKG